MTPAPFVHLVWCTEEKYTEGTRWHRHCNCPATACFHLVGDTDYLNMDDFIRDLDYPLPIASKIAETTLI